MGSLSAPGLVGMHVAAPECLRFARIVDEHRSEAPADDRPRFVAFDGRTTIAIGQNATISETAGIKVDRRIQAATVTATKPRLESAKYWRRAGREGREGAGVGPRVI